MADADVVREFLLESNENLTRLDQAVVELEQRPDDKSLLGDIFRTFHTIKGSCGFLGFGVLERLTHQIESILAQVRSGERPFTGTIAALVLEAVDAVRSLLLTIESSGDEGNHDFSELMYRLEAALNGSERAVQTTSQSPAASTEGHVQTADTAIRVDVGLLDKLMNLVGELVLARNQVLQFTGQREDVALNATSQRLNLITTELQESVMKTRMQPIGIIWNKFPRVARDLSHASGKQIRLEMDGCGTELDKTIIEAIKDPLTHLVRNCCDHGIEKTEERVRSGKPPHGTVRLKAWHEGGQVNIEVSDDGAGIDAARVVQKAIEKGLIRAEQAERMGERELLHLIMLPGLSTAETVTNVSGRGVGMDVVRTNVERIGGVVDLSSVPGAGTVFRMKIPLTLAIIPGLIVTSGAERFMIPQASLIELVRIDRESELKIEHVHGTPVYRRRGGLLPIVYLDRVLGLAAATEGDVTNVVVLQVEDRQFGLVVDSIRDTQEIVVKPLGKQLKGLSVYAGATIMGDGRVALILDVPGIAQRSNILVRRDEQARAEHPATAATGIGKQRLLLFKTGSFDRVAVPLALVGRLEEFQRAQLERSGGRNVVQYRGGILDVVSLSSILDPDSPNRSGGIDPVQVIVFADRGRSFGVIVDEILDIVEDDLSVRHPGQRPGLLGSAVVARTVTDLLDVRYVIERAAAKWLSESGGRGGTRVLVAGSSDFDRALVRNELETAGYEVAEASTCDEALARLANRDIRAVLCSPDLAALPDLMRGVASASGIPALPLGSPIDSVLHSLSELASRVGSPAREDCHA